MPASEKTDCGWAAVTLTFSAFNHELLASRQYTFVGSDPESFGDTPAQSASARPALAAWPQPIQSRHSLNFLSAAPMVASSLRVFRKRNHHGLRLVEAAVNEQPNVAGRRRLADARAKYPLW